MNNSLSVSESKTYGKMRHTCRNGEILFLGSDVIHALGFSNKAFLIDCVDENDRREIEVFEPDTARYIPQVLVNFCGVQTLVSACKSKVDTKSFKSWLIHIGSSYYGSDSKKVYTTKDYSMFKRLSGNRDVLQPRIKKIKQSISEVGYVTNPLIVNENFEVIDGQGRLEALKELNLPVEYIIQPGIGTKECISLNENHSSWKVENYIATYVTEKKDDYQRLQDLAFKYSKIPVSIIASAVSERNVNTKEIRKGNFKLPLDIYNRNEDCLKYLNAFIPVLKRKKRTRNCIYTALIFSYYCKEINNKKLLEKFTERYDFYGSPSTVEEAIRTIEDIYNKGLKGNKVYLSHIFETAKNKINPNKR